MVNWRRPLDFLEPQDVRGPYLSWTRLSCVHRCGSRRRTASRHTRQIALRIGTRGDCTIQYDLRWHFGNSGRHSRTLAQSDLQRPQPGTPAMRNGGENGGTTVLAARVAESRELTDPGIPCLGDEFDTLRFESARASATSATRTANPASFATNGRSSRSGSQKLSVTFGVSSSPSVTSLSGSPRTSRYHATRARYSASGSR